MALQKSSSMEIFVNEFMKNQFNDSRIFREAIANISTAAKVIKNKLQGPKNAKTLEPNKLNLEEMEHLDQLSKTTKRNSQYKTKARTILFHMTNCFRFETDRFMQLPYRDLNQLPRYDAVDICQVKTNEKLNATNELMYEHYDTIEAYQETFNLNTRKRTHNDGKKMKRIVPNFYWDLEQAKIIESMGEHIIKHLYVKFETTLAKDKAEIFNKNPRNDDKKECQREQNWIVVKEDEIVAKLMLALICEFDLDKVLKYLNEKMTARNEHHIEYCAEQFLEHTTDILYSQGDGIVNNIEKERVRIGLIEKRHTQMLKVLFERAQYLKYKLYHPINVINDDNNHEPLDISMFSTHAKCLLNIYCYETNQKLSLQKSTLTVRLNTMEEKNINIISPNDGQTIVFDVLDLPFESCESWKQKSWHVRLSAFEHFIQTRVSKNSVKFITILPQLKKISRLQILYDGFPVSENTYIYIRTESLGLGSIFVKDCKSVDKHRSKRTKRHRKIKQCNLNKTQNSNRRYNSLLDVNEEESEVIQYDQTNAEEMVQQLLAPLSIYTAVNMPNDFMALEYGENEEILEDDENLLNDLANF